MQSAVIGIFASCAYLRFRFFRQLRQLVLKLLIGIGYGHGQRSALVQMFDMMLDCGIETASKLFLRGRLKVLHHLPQRMQESDTARIGANNSTLGILDTQPSNAGMHTGIVYE